MAINFGDIPTNEVTLEPAAVEAAPAGGGLNLNLSKGDFLNISKAAPELEEVLIGCGWDVASTGSEFDLDLSAIMTRANDKLIQGSDVIFYNNTTATGLTYGGDNRTGAGDGDDETFVVNLKQVQPDVISIYFAVTIHEAASRNQTFGMVNNAYCRLVDKKTNKELCKYSLSNEYATSTGVIIARLHKDNGQWKFQALGEGRVQDLNQLAMSFQ